MPFYQPRWNRHRPLTVLKPIRPQAGQYLRRVAPIVISDSLEKVITRLQREQLPALPVVEGMALVGWVTAHSIARHLSIDSRQPREVPVAEVMAPIPQSIHPSASPEEVSTILSVCGEEMLPVVLAGDLYQGCVTLVDTLAVLSDRYALPRIGGMATPLGVYLTSGTVSGGVGTWGLVLAGAMMAAILWIVQMALIYGTYILQALTGWSFVHLLFTVLVGKSVSVSPVMEIVAFIINMMLVTGGFLLALRYGPRIAGYHAAEHQTVHAIEAGEPLRLESVSRMPRVHPRCGTNLWGLLSLTYLGLAMLMMLLSTTSGRGNLTLVLFFVLVYALFLMGNWRRVGGWLQQHLTTRPATRAELESGIRAGEEVLLRQRTISSTVPPHRFHRFWKMGLVQVMVGAILVSYLLDFLTPMLDALVNNLLK